MKRLALLLALALGACAQVPPAGEPPHAPRVSVPPAAEKPDPQAEAGPAATPLPLPPLTEPPPTPPDETKQVAELLAYAQRLPGLSAEESRKDYNVISQAYARDRSVMNRLKLALALSTPGSPVQDDARAAQTLEGLGGSGTPLRQFAAFLQAQLAERARANRRADQFREQLDALRAVERSIIERGDASPPRKP